MGVPALTKDEWDTLTGNLAFRSDYRCESCGGRLEGLARHQVEIQHRRARGAGGSHAPDTNLMSNLLILHGWCHREIEDRRGDEALNRGLWIRHEYRAGVLIPATEYPLQLFSGRLVLLGEYDLFYQRHPDEWGALRIAATLAARSEEVA